MYKINEHVEIDIFEEGAVIQLDDGFYAIDLIAYEILQQFIRTQNIEDTIQFMAKTYKEDLNVITEDVMEIVDNYKNLGILQELGESHV